MPTELQPREAPPAARVTVSAIAELVYVMFAISEPEAKSGHPSLRELLQQRRELVDTVAGFWNDGYNEWSEIMLLAHRTGTLLDDRPGRFFARLDGVLQEEIRVPELPTEPMEVRGIIEERLRKLRTSAELRARYESLLHEVWALLEPLWESDGRPIALSMASRLREHRAERADIAPLLPKHHFALREQYLAVVERALRRGEVVLIPLGLAGPGMAIFALPGVLIIGFGPDAESRPQAGREMAAAAAARFKVLSDPTRLSILKTLQGCPFTITDIARLYELSQPTVSVHVKALRQAGLVEAERHDGRTLYHADRETTRAFVGAALDEL